MATSLQAVARQCPAMAFFFWLKVQVVANVATQLRHKIANMAKFVYEVEPLWRIYWV